VVARPLMSRTRIVDDTEKQRLVEEWDASGLSAAEFGQRRGVRAETLQAWGRAIRGPLRRRRPRTRPMAKSIALVEVASGLPADSPADRRIEIDLSEGRRLVVHANWTPALIAEIARALEVKQ
jgi:hypothetical protein